MPYLEAEVISRAHKIVRAHGGRKRLAHAIHVAVLEREGAACTRHGPSATHSKTHRGCNAPADDPCIT